MTDLREAAKRALEALEEVRDARILALELKPSYHETIAALKRALAEDAMDRMAENARELGLDYGVSLKTIPHLPDDFNPDSLEQVEIELPDPETVCPHGSQACKECYERGYVAGMDSQLFANDISQERVDTSEEQRHEPVAMRWDFDGYGYRYIDSGSGSNWQTRVKDAEPLYTHPQQCPNCTSLMEQNTELDKKLSEWVGLTDEEIEKCKFDSLNGTGWSLNVDINLFYKSVEAKLKEKNR